MRYAVIEASNRDFRYNLNMNISFIACVGVNISSKSYTPKSSSKKNYRTTFIALSIGSIYQKAPDIMPRNLFSINQ